MLPNLIVIGSRKCATTSLHHYLNLHPEIFMSQTHKELNFFVAEMFWKKGVSWYERQFPVKAPVRGESSPNYSRFPVWKGVPERMHSIVPNAKLIYIVRNPVERLISAYHHDFKGGLESRTFEEMVSSRLKENPHFHDSRYYFQLTQFLKYYPLSRIHVVPSEQLSDRPYAVMQEIFKFLGVDATFQSKEFCEMKNVLAETVRRKQCKLEHFAGQCGRKNQWLGQIAGAAVPIYLKLRKRKTLQPRENTAPPLVSIKTKELLQEFFRKDIQKLSALTGQQFEKYFSKVASPSHSQINKRAQQFGDAFKLQKERGGIQWRD